MSSILVYESEEQRQQREFLLNWTSTPVKIAWCSERLGASMIEGVIVKDGSYVACDTVTKCKTCGVVEREEGKLLCMKCSVLLRL